MMRMRPLTQPLVSDCSAFLFSTELGQRYYPLRKLLDDAVEKPASGMPSFWPMRVSGWWGCCGMWRKAPSTPTPICT